MDGDSGAVVRYDESQTLTDSEQNTARGNIGAAPDTLTDEVHALHGLVDYDPQYGQISGTNYATITRIGDVININGTHGGGIVTGRIVINGALAYANSNTAFAGLEHAGIKLTVGHKYALRLTHISGAAVRLTDAPNAICYPYVYVNGTDNPPTSPTDGNATTDAGGYDAAYTFTYDQSLEPGGVLLSVNIKRLQSGTPTFTNYRFAVTLEDITDATETHGIPSGGTAGQVLTKASGTDYDATWTTPQGGGVSDVQVNGTSVVTDGVANVPIATNSTLGVVMASDGLQMSSAQNGKIMLAPASSSQIKGGVKVNVTNDISKQHESVFYGLAKAAGDTTQSASSNAVGQYTESAKSAIHTMLSGSVSVSGTTPVITALPGIRYICGEVSTLDITLPASGCIDVVFESGSTPTVLTVTAPTGKTLSWTGDFNPTELEADTVYEINAAVVGDKCLGVAGAWT